MSTIKLQSSDGEVFEVDIEVAKKSETIKTMLESLSNGDNSVDEVVPIMKVRGEVLKKVIDWSEYHMKDNSEEDLPPVLKEPYQWPLPTDDITEWDQEFMNVDMGTTFELILAANFLEIKGLMDLACKSVANQITGKSAFEMRKIFNLAAPKRYSQTLKNAPGS